ncbi:RNA polymerase sigma factor [Sporosarcina beigongshangi]|uniref:RNA polymerase sigma factor n=1 Tax=Sporosarcina beigongshangi TaxID=2782538 RepID=UPI00193A5785|nr:RNA polymerase sigma factor [Sporosarcina beigongshangi]
MEQSEESIYLEHSDRIYRYIFLQVRQKELAEDLTQETFYRAFKNLHTFQKQASLSTWLLKIAKNATYDHFRRKRIIQFFSMGKEEVTDAISFSPEDEYLKKDSTQRLYNALASLKKDYREVLLLRKINESSIKETAYILGWTETKVKSTMARAFAALKKEMLEREGRIDE